MARVRTLAGRPIEQHSSPNQGGAMDDCRGVVLHIAEGSYRGTISWQLNPDQRYANGDSVTTCSTWIVGRAEGEWAQMVDTTKIAWCQRSGSRTWLSIELAGHAPAAPSAWQIEACAQLLAWAHREHNVPLAVADHPGERGLGHHSMDREAMGEEWGHDSCPGTGVIAAKAAIVKRAQAIVAGEDDEVGKITDPKQAQQLGDSHFVLTQVPMPDGTRKPAHVALGALAAKVDLIANAIADPEPPDLSEFRDKLDKIDREATERAAAEEQRDAQRHAELLALVEAGLSGERDAKEVLQLVGEAITAAAQG